MKRDALIDSFGRYQDYLRISVTDRCNLRCIYCMPSQEINFKQINALLSFDEIERIVHLFAEMGITKIRITGGEPLIRKDLPDLICRLSNIYGINTIGMTTNGVFLKKNVQLLKKSRLSHLNISLDTLKLERFERITLRNHFYEVLDGINAAIASGFVPLKINTVIMKNINDDEIMDFVELVKNRPINVRFIEYMPFKFNQWNMAEFVPYQEMKQIIEQRYRLFRLEEKNHSSAAKEFYIEGFAGTISFISPMSDSFCDTCSRLRLTADGSLKSCLFGPAEVNLCAALRGGATDEDIIELIHHAVILKPQGHPPIDKLTSIKNRTMIEIGG